VLAVGAEGEGAVEVGAADEDHRFRRLGARRSQGDGNDLVGRQAAGAMVLPDGEQPRATQVGDQVRVAHGAGRRDGLACATGRGSADGDTVEPVVRPLGVIDDPVVDRPGTTAVLVDTVVDVGAHRRQVLDATAIGRSDDDRAAILRGPPLEPGDRLAIDARLAGDDPVEEQRLDRDRRSPAAEGCDRRRHRASSLAGRAGPLGWDAVRVWARDYVPLCQELT
jgi:hypothetical protein